MTVNVPKSTVEKPLTPIDYIAAMAECSTAREVSIYAERVPLDVRDDERFSRAVLARLDAIREKRRQA